MSPLCVCVCVCVCVWVVNGLFKPTAIVREPNSLTSTIALVSYPDLIPVSYLDLIQHVYRFQYNTILKVIALGLVLGLGLRLTLVPTQLLVQVVSLLLDI